MQSSSSSQSSSQPSLASSTVNAANAPAGSAHETAAGAAVESARAPGSAELASATGASSEAKAAPAGVHVTPAAVQYAKQRLAQRNTPDAAIRLGIRGGGCSGFSYVIEFSDEPPRARDIVSEFEGVRFYVDKKSMLYLSGATLDYVKTVMFQGFQFLNPVEASRCGCGHSFTVR